METPAAHPRADRVQQGGPPRSSPPPASATTGGPARPPAVAHPALLTLASTATTFVIYPLSTCR
ncbi:hypothetical protein QJS66_15220 [Kocuria rhizophila]|nr:hypothetical protein QJS66_15220 [Kocuria rhizophila]